MKRRYLFIIFAIGGAPLFQSECPVSAALAADHIQCAFGCRVHVETHLKA